MLAQYCTSHEYVEILLVLFTVLLTQKLFFDVEENL